MYITLASISQPSERNNHHHIARQQSVDATVATVETLKRLADLFVCVGCVVRDPARINTNTNTHTNTNLPATSINLNSSTKFVPQTWIRFEDQL